MVSPSTNHPALSVVIPVRNEEKHLGVVLEQLAAQSLPAEEFEVLVVDGMSDDRTREVVAAFHDRLPNLHLLDNPGILSGRARNVGARHARAPYILFVDGHCRIASPLMLASALTAFRQGEKCLSRPQPLATGGVSDFQAAVALARQSFLGHYTGSKIFEDKDHHCNPLSAGCGYEKSLYFEIGGVDESFDAGEDLEFNYRVHRLGIKAYHSQNFTVEYISRHSWIALARQLYRYGYGRARMARKFPEAFSPLPFLLGMAVVTAAVLPLVGLLYPPAFFAWSAGLGGYFLVTALAAALQSRAQPLPIFLHAWRCFPAIHLGGGLGYLSGLLGGPSWSPSLKEKVRKPAAVL